MSGGRLQTVLRAFGGAPKTLQELGAELGSSTNVIEGMLDMLLRGGYVQPAVADTDGCGCNGCSLKSLCRAADGATPPLPLLRLTPRGEAYLRECPA